MKRPLGTTSAVVVCALLALQAGAGGASAVTGGEPAAAVASAAGDPDGARWPEVAAAPARPGDGARITTVRADGTAPRHDYDGDGRSDMAAWYDYSEGDDAVHTFTARADGGFLAPVAGWRTGTGNFWAEHMKRVTGDFNGDGIGDIAAFYGYDDGRVSLFTWLGTGDGSFADYTTSWAVPSGQWAFDAMTVQAGDFDGDSRDDVAVWYDHRNGDKLFTFLADADGGFAAPFSSFERSAADGWEVGHMKFATGDYDGDGRDDIGVLDSYTAGTVRLMHFPAGPDGGFGEPVRGWESTGWQFVRTSVHSGDFDGDGRDELAAWYDYADGHDAVFGFGLTAAGAFGGKHEMLNSPEGWYTRARMYLVTGDYDGDGRDDLGALYGYTDGRVKTLTFTAGADGTLAEALHSWETPRPTDWTFGRAHMIERHTNPLPLCPTVYGHGGYPTGANAGERDQIRQPNHPTGLAQQKSWGAGGVEADLRLTREGTKAVMWHNESTRGLTGTQRPVADIWWATGTDRLKGRTIDTGPYKGETVYTFREWLDSARAQEMAAFVELKKENKPTLTSNDTAIRENAWNEVIAPITERASRQKIMIYASDVTLRAELTERMEAAGLGAALADHPRWIDDGSVGWEEPPPSVRGHYAMWHEKLNQYGSSIAPAQMVTTWTKEFTAWLDGKCR
ncbi:FG-GAP-like repeat-containing protein [Streptomyces nitrosporeus]|uniref:FG-GAP-like repeat-containing protein n=1 Tax=Streptomyces nitrosporeus TaxID=28894 RepID=UPI0033189913